MLKFKNLIELSYTLAITQFKLRNEGSLLGFLWYFLNPLLLFLSLLVVFGNHLNSQIQHYPAFLFVGVMLHNFFSTVTNESTQIIISNGLLIKSLKFNFLALLFALFLRNLFTHILEFFIFVLVLSFYDISLVNLIYYPFILLIFSLMIFGFTLILSSLNVIFMDLKNIWTFIQTLILLSAPVFHQIEKDHTMYQFLKYNPLYPFLNWTRNILIYNRPTSDQSIYEMLIMTSIVLFLGLLIYAKLYKSFAERL